MSDNPVMQAVGKIAAANRKVNVRPGALEEARIELQVARLTRAIDRETEPVDMDPGYEPLPLDQRRELARRLMGPGPWTLQRKK